MDANVSAKTGENIYLLLACEEQNQPRVLQCVHLRTLHL